MCTRSDEMYAFSTEFKSLVSTIINISYLSLFYTIEGAGNFFLKISSKYHLYLLSTLLSG